MIPEPAKAPFPTLQEVEAATPVECKERWGVWGQNLPEPGESHMGKPGYEMILYHEIEVVRAIRRKNGVVAWKAYHSAATLNEHITLQHEIAEK